MVKSIYDNQTEIIESILNLHVPSKKIDLDPTYSKGIFYKNNNIKEPYLKYDLIPQVEGCNQADCRNLPIENNSIECIMFDPPFVVSSGPSLNENKKNSNIISKRFSCFYPVENLFKFYNESLKEFYRILKDDGILIFKCQDTVSSGINYMSHIYIHNMALNIGFYPKDLFILEAKNRIISGKIKNQCHARKYHSYFFVLEKNNKKINKILNINKEIGI
jgi:hypothetical protein